MVQVTVQHGNIDQALRILRKKVQREGIARKMKISYYEKPSEKRLRKSAESQRRRSKMESKRVRFEL